MLQGDALQRYWAASLIKARQRTMSNTPSLLRFTGSLRTAWPIAKYCSRGTLLYLGLQSSHLNICYYHQDLQLWYLHPGLCRKLHAHHSDPPARYNHSVPELCAVVACHTWPAWLIVAAAYISHAPAPSIFRDGWFGRWVATQSLAVSDFHGHRPTVSINQHVWWYLMSVAWGTLTRRLVLPIVPVLLTKNSPLGTHIQGQTQFRRVKHLTHLKFAKRLNAFRHQCLLAFALPDKTVYISECQLSWGKLRRGPATRWSDWFFAPILKLDDRFARQNRCGYPAE